ncbi:MAG: D-alanyl-D-alanine carboxypeptidase family protein [Oscillospiraceae bacterium]
MLKRFFAVILAAALLIPAASAEASGPPALSAASAILVDGESGRVLFEQNAREQRSIASITKLMTALVAAESADDLQEEVTIRPEWTGIEGSSIYLRAGETVTLETLLYGLLLNSGNDAAIAVAAHCAGDVDAFVQRMNDRAAELGMEQTHFTNPNGLSEDGHYSTAYDMALLARACLENETVAKIAATKSITLGTRTFTNHNKLLWRYEGCTGMKTGYTEKAGRTLVSSAQRDGRTLIAVTLCAPNDWADHAALFDYGFAMFPRQVLCTAGKEFRRVPVQGGLVPFVSVVTAEDLYFPLAEGEQVQAQVSLPNFVESPVEEGAALGKLSFYLGDTLIGETDLLAASAVHREAAQPRSLWERVRDWLGD